MQSFFKRFLYVLLPALVLCLGLLGFYALMLIFGANTVSFTFLIGFPMIGGAVVLYFRPKDSFPGFWGGVGWLAGIFFMSIALSYVSGLEGLICIAMAAGPIFFGALLGGILLLVAERWDDASQGTLKALSLPICILIGLSYAQAPQRIYIISNTVIIEAAPADVFALLQNIPDITPQEVPTHASHWLGIPKPTAAIWEGSNAGAVRHSYWGEGVHFQESITDFELNKRIAWDFAFPEGWIVEGIQDPHITVGGPYFDILSGEYSLAAHGTGTALTLTTRTFDGSQLGAYAKFWHHFFFEDFHEAILTVVKNRAETQQAI